MMGLVSSIARIIVPMTFFSMLGKVAFPILLSFSMYKPDVSEEFNSTYDYIIVGAGSAGSVVANRLSEDPCVKVLILEAGPKPNVLTEVPAMALFAENTENDWSYRTVPQKRGGLKLKDQRLVMPRGKGLGGTSLLNFMMYVRGNRMDYDTWAKQGATGWAWKDVLPYFLKSEDNKDPEIANNGYHRQGGYLTVQSLQYNNSLIRAWAKAAPERGYEVRDINGEKQTGFSKMQGTLRNGRRCSTAKAFLIPAQDRQNLDIVDNALVTKILINKNKEAYGVNFVKNNQQYEVHANKEIIVSGGTINSPQILMLSGIGPRDHLQQLGIPVIVDLPVGNNLQDHVGTFFLHFEATKAEDLLKQIFSNPFITFSRFNTDGTGPISSLSGTEGQAFVNSKYNDPSLDWPDLEIHLESVSPSSDLGLASTSVLGVTEEVFNQVYAPYIGKNTFTFYPCYLRPKSRGTVRLASTDPQDHPLIDPNLFEVEEDLDRLVEVLKECVAIVTETKAFKEIGAKMFTTKFPGCETHKLYSEDYLTCIAKLYTFNLYHPVGTCKMGLRSDDTTVVDPQLRVKGVKNLRVVDGSIIPNQVSGNTNAPIIMIGEKASDMIKSANKDRLTCA